MKKSLTKTLMSAAAAGFILLFVAIGGWSMPPGEGPGPDPARMLAHMSKTLDLSEEQAAAVKSLLTSSFEEAAPDMQRLHTLHEELRDQRADFDAASARKMADEIGAITGRMVFRRASTDARIFQLLNEEQRAKMNTAMEKRDERRDEWRSRMKDRPE